MKNIINYFAVIICFGFIITISSCKKNKDAIRVKQTRLTSYTYSNGTNTSSYTIAYNATGKISTVQFLYNGTLNSTKKCFYSSGNVLDSIVENYAAGGSNITRIIWSGNKIIKYGTINLTYNSKGLVDKKIYAAGNYFRNEYIGDSVFLYYSTGAGSETIRSKYKLSSNIKNPFLIAGFEKEAYITTELFYYNNGSNALLPNIESSEIIYNGNAIDKTTTYTFNGDFNGYALKRTGSGITETYTYEEF